MIFGKDRRCIECHRPAGQGYEKSGFDLTTYEGLMKGTKYGSMVVPGNPDMSNLMLLLDWKASPELNMPHGKKQLSTCDRDAIREWIRREPKTISCRDLQIQIAPLGASDGTPQEARLRLRLARYRTAFLRRGVNSKTASTHANSPVRKARIATIEVEVTALLGSAERLRLWERRPPPICQNYDQECGEEDRHNTKVWDAKRGFSSTNSP
jgi:hypothetical protein